MTHITEELVEPVVPREDRVTRHTHQEDLKMIGPQLTLVTVQVCSWSKLKHLASAVL